jgi:hypothetical protein
MIFYAYSLGGAPVRVGHRKHVFGFCVFAGSGEEKEVLKEVIRLAK